MQEKKKKKKKKGLLFIYLKKINKFYITHSNRYEFQVCFESNLKSGNKINK